MGNPLDTVSRKALIEWMDEILEQGSPEVKLGVACVYAVVAKGRFDIPSTESEGEAALRDEMDRLKDAANTYYLISDQFRQVLGVGTVDHQGVEDGRQKLKSQKAITELAVKKLSEILNLARRFNFPAIEVISEKTLAEIERLSHE